MSGHMATIAVPIPTAKRNSAVMRLKNIAPVKYESLLRSKRK
jgi:hypothetical protein